MQTRIYVQMDHASESMRYIATATRNGEVLHEIAKYGGPEIGENLFRALSEWLEQNGYKSPDYYWMQTFLR